MSKKLIFSTLICFISTLGIYGCSDPVSDQDSDLPTEISGFVQKGPFINGTQVSLYELNSELGQTGNNFLAQINNDIGSFKIDNIDLNSNNVLLSADGYYFNEITGEISSSQLTLTALSDLNDRSTVNINILTHLERQRIEQLISEGNSFEESKIDAQQEILSIFGFDEIEINESESLDISQENEESAILLAISLILQGNRSVGDLSELLANISSDFQSDGVLSDESIIDELLSSAFQINYDDIRNNLEKRYESLEIDAIVPEFEKYVDQFVGYYFELTCNDLQITDEQGNQLGYRGDPSDQWKVTFNKNEKSTGKSSSHFVAGEIETPPTEYRVFPAYPNPVKEYSSAATNFMYELPVVTDVKVVFLDTNRNQYVVTNESHSAGRYSRTVSFEELQSGCYQFEFYFDDTSYRNAYGLVLVED